MTNENKIRYFEALGVVGTVVINLFSTLSIMSGITETNSEYYNRVSMIVGVIVSLLLIKVYKETKSKRLMLISWISLNIMLIQSIPKSGDTWDAILGAVLLISIVDSIMFSCILWCKESMYLMSVLSYFSCYFMMVYINNTILLDNIPRYIIGSVLMIIMYEICDCMPRYSDKTENSIEDNKFLVREIMLLFNAILLAGMLNVQIVNFTDVNYLNPLMLNNSIIFFLVMVVVFVIDCVINSVISYLSLFLIMVGIHKIVGSIMYLNYSNKIVLNVIEISLFLMVILVGYITNKKLIGREN